MEVRGQHLFAAPRRATWDALLDPGSLQAALPGCEGFEESGLDRYDVTLRVGISSIKGRYRGSVTVRDREPLDSYRLSVDGSGKPGRIRGTALITLREDGERTVVEYVAEVAAQGALARLGSRLLGGAAKLLASQFFRGMEEEVANRVT